MTLFQKIYQKTLELAQHKFAVRYLAVLSMVESFILPYPPPDILLVPMALKNTKKAYTFALICTIFSVIGGLIGYVIGYAALDLITPLLERLGYMQKLEVIKGWFNEYGIAIVFIAGFSPIPYKIFTIGAGMMSMALLPFILISILARGLRFFLVTWIVKKFGEKCDEFIKKYVDYLGYGIIIIIILFIGYKSL